MSDKKFYHGHRPYYNKNKSSNPAAETPSTPPHPQVQTVPELEKAVSENLSEETLVKAIGIAWNKYCWYEEREAKVQSDEAQYSETCEQTDSWCECYYHMIEKLKSYLHMDPDAVFALPELSAYMGKYNLEDIDGVWRGIRKKSPEAKPQA